MRVRLMGTSAGGGVPQWNCNCVNCFQARNGKNGILSRTQSSIAVSVEATPGSWVLFNASPDIGNQLKNWQQATPIQEKRASPICAVIIVDSQIDHCTGLLSLREHESIHLFCTDAAYEDLTTVFPIIQILGHYCLVVRTPILDNLPFEIPNAPGLKVNGLFVDGKAPPYSPHRKHQVPGTNVALEVTDMQTGNTLLYAPGVEVIDERLAIAMKNASCILIDGTFWTDDEMSKNGISTKRAKEMGHLSLSEPGGIVDWLKKFPSARRILVHINNTNPILNPNSPETIQLDSLGIEVGFDGMEIEI